MKSWDELKQEGSQHYKSGAVEPIDLFRVGGMFHDKACSDIIKYAFRSRLEMNIRGTIMTTWSIGCLCDLSPEYDPYTNNWNHGFALINVEKDGDFEVRNFRILPNGKVV